MALPDLHPPGAGEVGAAVGLVTGLVTPGLKYHAKSGEEIYVILLEDAAVARQAL